MSQKILLRTFDSPRKHQKTYDFLMFSGESKVEAFKIVFSALQSGLENVFSLNFLEGFIQLLFDSFHTCFSFCKRWYEMGLNHFSLVLHSI